MKSKKIKKYKIYQLSKYLLKINFDHSFLSYSTRRTLPFESKCFDDYFSTEFFIPEPNLLRTIGRTIRPLKRPSITIPKYILK